METIRASADDIQFLSQLQLLKGILIAPPVETSGGQTIPQAAKDITKMIDTRGLLNDGKGILQSQLEYVLLQLEQKLAQNGEDPVVLNDLACLLALSGRYEEARDMLAKAEQEADLRWQAARDAMLVPNIVEEAADTLAQSARDLQDPQTTRAVLEVLQHTEQALHHEARALRSVKQDDIVAAIQHNLGIARQILDNAAARQAYWGKAGAGSGPIYAKALRYRGARSQWLWQALISLLALAGLGAAWYAFPGHLNSATAINTTMLVTGCCLLALTLLFSLISEHLRTGILLTGALLLAGAVVLALVSPTAPPSPPLAGTVFSLPVSQIRSDLSTLGSGTPVTVILENSGQQYSFSASIYQVTPAATPTPCVLGTPVPTSSSSDARCLNTDLTNVSITLLDPAQDSAFMDQLNIYTIIFIQPG